MRSSLPLHRAPGRVLPERSGRGLRSHWPGHGSAGAGGNTQLVFLKIELDFKHTLCVRNRTRRQATGIHVQRDVPPMVQRRAERHANLPHDLRPHVESAIGLLPFFQWQRRPGLLAPQRGSIPFALYAAAFAGTTSDFTKDAAGPGLAAFAATPAENET